MFSDPSHVGEHSPEGHRPCDEGHRGGQEQELRRSTQAVRARRRVLLARNQVRGSIGKGQSLHQSKMCKIIIIQLQSYFVFQRMTKKVLPF